MKKLFFTSTILVLVILLSFIFFNSLIVLAETTGTGGAPIPAQSIPTPPTQGLPTNLGQLIQQIFSWSLSILGIAVFVVFFYSGFLWLTAAGNTARTGEAKTHMTNAVFGAILLLSSYLILYTINPDFVRNTVNLPGLGTTEPASELSLSCTEKSLTDNYGGDIRNASDQYLAVHPEIADKPSYEDLTAVAQLRDGVIAILTSQGFKAGTVLDPSGSPYPQVVALGRPADSDATVYRITAGGGVISEAIKVAYCDDHMPWGNVK